MLYSVQMSLSSSRLFYITAWFTAALGKGILILPGIRVTCQDIGNQTVSRTGHYNLFNWFTLV